jgi:hypothetical protein
VIEKDLNDPYDDQHIREPYDRRPPPALQPAINLSPESRYPQCKISEFGKMRNFAEE